MIKNQMFIYSTFSISFLQAKGYHDHAKPESKSPAELRKSGAYKRKFGEKTARRSTKPSIPRSRQTPVGRFSFSLSCLLYLSLSASPAFINASSTRRRHAGQLNLAFHKAERLSFFLYVCLPALSLYV